MTTVDGRVAWNGLRGALIGLAWVGGLFAAAPIVGGFGLVPIADVVIAVSPGWFAATMIGLLGSLAQPALVAGIVLALTAFTATVGVCWSRVSGTDRRTAEGLAIAIGAVASGWLFVGVGAGVSGDTLVAVVLAVAPAYLVAGLFGDRWPVIAERSSESEATTPPGRRRFFGRVGVLFAGALSLGAIRGLLGRLLGPHAADRATEPLPHEVSPPTGELREFDL